MSRKIVSIFDRKDDEDHQQDGQAFYAGGSEHSGQQILGPGSDGIIENLLNDARRHAETNPTPSSNTLPVTFWRNGFTVGDDNELRDYASNRQFLDCLRRGEVPPELAARVRGGMIDVKLDNKASQDYKPEQRQQAFAGEGFRLGAPAPEVVGTESEQPQQQQTTSNGGTSASALDEMRMKRLARFAKKET